MKIRDVLASTKERFGEMTSEGAVIQWLSNLDHRIKLEVIDQYEGAENVPFEKYTEETPTGKELLVEAPYDEMYLHYVASIIYFENEEMVRYNNAIIMFNHIFESFRKQYHRTHKTKPVRIKFF